MVKVVPSADLNRRDFSVLLAVSRIKTPGRRDQLSTGADGRERLSDLLRPRGANVQLAAVADPLFHVAFRQILQYRWSSEAPPGGVVRGQFTANLYTILWLVGRLSRRHLLAVLGAP